MKKIYLINLLLAAGVFICAKSMAQPTLTAANNEPTVGYSYNSGNVTPAVPTSTGANVTWDYSTLSPSGTMTMSYIDPSTTPNASSYPNANLAVNQGGGSYAYYSATSSDFSLVGASSSSVNVPYSDPQKYFTYPFTYQSSFNDTFGGSYTASGISAQRIGTATCTGIGYGTLKLPYGTFSNVLLVKYVYKETDTIPSYGYGTTTTDTTFMWYTPNLKAPLLTTSSTNGTVSGQLLDSTDAAAGINELAAFSGFTSLYPNPATNISTIHYNMQHAANVSVSLYNMLGQKVRENKLGKQTSGSKTVNINTATLPKGVYLVNLKAEGTIITKKLIVE